MNRVVVSLLVIIAFALGAGAGAFGILYSTGNLEPSDVAPIPTLSLDSPTATPGAADQLSADIAALDGKLDALSAQVSALGTAVAAGGVAAQPAAPEAAVETEAAAVETEAVAEAEAADGLTGRALYRISEDGSEARFLIDEVLNGSAITVVGTTRRVAGDIIVDFDTPTGSQVGAIAINARTFATDNEFRNQAIRSRILFTDDFEFITFEPVELIGLDAASVAIGGSAQFQIRGNLTVRDITREVIFDASVTIDSAEQISGTASTTVSREDYDLTFNTPPTVTDVGQELTLELDFIAELVESAS
jgi:polyisoprenoid-binding protein YceI